MTYAHFLDLRSGSVRELFVTPFESKLCALFNFPLKGNDLYLQFIEWVTHTLERPSLPSLPFPTACAHFEENTRDRVPVIFQDVVPSQKAFHATRTRKSRCDEGSSRLRSLLEIHKNARLAAWRPAVYPLRRSAPITFNLEVSVPRRYNVLIIHRYPPLTFSLKVSAPFRRRNFLGILATYGTLRPAPRLSGPHPQSLDHALR
jgi:hypothetical protein